MSLTRGHSCVLCQQRKVRCDRQKPCANCVKAQVECRIVPMQAPRRRKKTPQECYLLRRLKKYEAFMAQNGLDYGSIADNEVELDIAHLESELSELKTSLEDNEPTVASVKEDKRKLSKWFAYYKEYRITHDMLHDLIEDEYDRPTIHHAFDVMFDNNDSFPFFVGGSPVSLASSHPSTIKIFQTWQVYIENVNPLLKLSHIPTLQPQIVEASTDTTKISKHFEALMFAIYLISVHSMSDEETRRTLGEEKRSLLARYHQATQQALINVGFMKSNELVVLQAYLLYLYTTSQHVDPRSLFCLIGIAVRMATRLGLHKDGGLFGLSPLECELRKRLWWQIMILDQRIAGITGTTITALSSIEVECQIPLNLSDTSLHPNTKHPPAPDTGATEMTFCLTRIDFALASSSAGRRMSSSATKRSENMSPATAASSGPETGIPSAIRDTPRNIDGYCAHIEQVYLRHCDPNVASGLFTLLTARISLCNLRIADFLRRGVSATSLGEQEREKLFLAAVQMLEYDNMIYTTESVRGFLWYTHLHVPVLGYAFLVNELDYRRTGALCERAWTAIFTNHKSRNLADKHKSPMHAAFSIKLIKTWENHCEAERRLGRDVVAPPLIEQLRERYAYLILPERRAEKVSTQEMHSNAPAAPSSSSELPATGEQIVLPQRQGNMDQADEAGYEQMDWTQLMQFVSFEGLDAGTGTLFTGEFHNY